MFPFLTEDIDGRPRLKADVGAEELSTAPGKYGLLTEKDVGRRRPSMRSPRCEGKGEVRPRRLRRSGSSGSGS